MKSVWWDLNLVPPYPKCRARVIGIGEKNKFMKTSYFCKLGRFQLLTNKFLFLRKTPNWQKNQQGSLYHQVWNGIAINSLLSFLGYRYPFLTKMVGSQTFIKSR